MATWQFDLLLVPASAWETRRITPASALSDGTAEMWAKHDPDSMLSSLHILGPSVPCWSSSTTCWGAEEGTCLQLSLDGTLIDEVKMRIDMREPDVALLTTVLRLALDMNLVLITEDGDVLPPDLGEVLAAGERSSAGSFVRDPRAYLTALRNKPSESDNDG